MKKRLFQGVLVGVIILGAILAYSIWKATPLTAPAFFESGKKYYAEKKYPEAIIQFLNAVRKDPSHRDASYFLALSYIAALDLSRAAAQLQALLEYYPDDVLASLQLGRIYLTAGRSDPDLFRKAQEIAGKILSKDPENVDALILSGNASAGLQDYRSSIDLFEKALSLDPQNLSAFVSLGTSQALQMNYTEAEKAFLKARDVNPKDKGVLISLGNYYRAVGNPDKAEAVFKEALSLDPTDRTIYLQALQFYGQAGRLDEAEKVLRDAQAGSTAGPEPSLILASLFAGTNRPSEARKLLVELKEKFPENIDVATQLALNFLQDQPEQARKEIEQILKLDRGNPVGHVLQGELQFISGQFDAAEATLGQPPAIDSPYPQVHFFLGNIAHKKAQTDEAISHYQKSLAVNSGYLPARVALAEVLLGAGRIADSREEIRKAMDAQPDYVPARILKATIDGTDKNNTDAEREWMGLLKDQPENAIVHRQMGLYYDSRGRTAEAEKSLVRALDLQPDSQDSFRDLIGFYMRAKQTDRAIQKMNAVPDDKKQAFHYELLGLVYSQAGKFQDAENAYRKALEKDPAGTRADTYLVADYLKNGRVDDALQKLDDLIKKNPGNTAAYGMKGIIFERRGNFEGAKQNYSQALKLDPNAEIPSNNLAYILAEEGRDLDTALGLAQAARKKQPDNPDMADTLGWVYYKLGNYVLARDQVRFAVSKKPENAVFQYHLGVIYKENKQLPEAQSALKKALSSRQDFKEKGLAQAALNEISK